MANTSQVGNYGKFRLSDGTSITILITVDAKTGPQFDVWEGTDLQGRPVYVEEYEYVTFHPLREELVTGYGGS